MTAFQAIDNYDVNNDACGVLFVTVWLISSHCCSYDSLLYLLKESFCYKFRIQHFARHNSLTRDPTRFVCERELHKRMRCKEEHFFIYRTSNIIEIMTKWHLYERQNLRFTTISWRVHICMWYRCPYCVTLVSCINIKCSINPFDTIDCVYILPLIRRIS